jgi:hypothetical protein
MPVFVKMFLLVLCKRCVFKTSTLHIVSTGMYSLVAGFAIGF